MSISKATAPCQRFFIFLLLAAIHGCAAGKEAPPVPWSRGFEAEVAAIAANIAPGERVAVSWIYDVDNGDITALGNQWRDRIEKAVQDSGAPVTARQEIGFLIEDSSMFGSGVDESDIWRNSGADILVSGSYTVQQNPRGEATIALTIKALRVADTALLKSINWQDRLGPGWQRLATQVKGNAFQRTLASATDSGGDRPALAAHLDRDPPCYFPGSPARVEVETEPGVHLYLFNLAADNTVTLLYPGRLPDQPLPARTFVFPPPALARDLQLLFYPLQDGQFCQESIKVVASRRPLDFSFLPVPVNQMYAGAQGGEIKKIRDVLEKATDWRDVVLNYGVGGECRE